MRVLTEVQPTSSQIARELSEHNSSGWPSLRIVVVHYGDKAVLDGLFDSLESQRHVGDVKLVVVNNGPEALQGVPNKVGNFDLELIERLDNPGFGIASNQGAANAEEDVVLFLNPDTRLLDDGSLAELLEAFVSLGPNTMYSPLLTTEDREVDPACARSLPTWSNVAHHYLGLGSPETTYNLKVDRQTGQHDVGALNGAFMMLESQVLAELGGFNESYWMYGEDLDLCKRAQDLGVKCVLDTDLEVIHLKGATSERSKSKSLRYAFIKSMLIYANDHLRPRLGRG